MTKLERFKWTDYRPNIYVTYYYEYKRTDADMYYRVKTVIEPVTGESFFGYNILLTLTLDGSTKLSAKQLKGKTPNKWSNNLTYTTSWYKVPNKTSGTTTLGVRLYSTGGDDRNVLKTYKLPVTEYQASVGYFKTGGTYKKAAPYVKVNGVWKKTKRTYVKVNGTWKTTK